MGKALTLNVHVIQNVQITVVESNNPCVAV